MRGVSPGSPRKLCEDFHNPSRAILLAVALSRKKIVLWAAAAAAVTVGTLLIIAAVALREGGLLRLRFISALSAALNCDVSLKALDVQIVPVIKITGDQLFVRLRGRPDIPAYISVSRFTVDLGLLSVLRRHVDTVHLDGLQINVPPRASSDSGAAPTGPPAPGTPGALIPAPARTLFSVEHLVARDAILNFVGKEHNNRPLIFPIDELDIHDAGIDRAMRFTSSVRNTFPRGLVQTNGSFGPWNPDDPTQTRFTGTYVLLDGDLSTLNGISGHVASAGAFTGTLPEIHVAGTSTTPKLSLDLGGQPVPVTTEFTVTVDGTSGTTHLDRVNATVLKTPMVIAGTITNLPGPGQDVKLTVEVKDGRAEDLLRLAITSDKPLLTGGVSLTAAVRLPAGAASARQRIVVSGKFGLASAQFNNAVMQSKLQELSRRGLGKSADEAVSQVASSMSANFSLKQGVIALPNLTFAVPGAVISLEGTYNLVSENLNFTGTAALKASLSKAVGGFKSVFLAPFNGLFAKDGAGSVIPIEIAGTRSEPDFHVRMSQVFKKGKH